MNKDKSRSSQSGAPAYIISRYHEFRRLRTCFCAPIPLWLLLFTNRMVLLEMENFSNIPENPEYLVPQGLCNFFVSAEGVGETCRICAILFLCRRSFLTLHLKAAAYFRYPRMSDCPVPHGMADRLPSRRSFLRLPAHGRMQDLFPGSRAPP